MDLIVIESPNKIKKLRQILGSNYKILPTIGHFRDLPRAGLNVDTATFEATYEIVADKKEIVAELKAAAAKADKIYLASDPDREGEAISWHVAEVLQLKEPLRAEFNEITKAAVQKAIDKPRRLDMGLVEAQQSRRILDRLVGYIVSPELRMLGTGLSAGRVQSCVLHLICKREQEREAFDVRKYWTISATYENGLSAGVAELADDGRLKLVQFEQEEQAAQLVEALRRATHVVRDVEGSDVERKPKPPFETSSLLKAAGIAFGWKTDRTTKVAQGLFESGLITYPRTDSLNASPEAQEAARAVLAERYPEALPEKPPAYRSKAGAQEAHECIRPTQVDNEAPREASGDGALLYGLIWKRFLASQAKPALFAKTLVTIEAGETMLRAIGMLLLAPGFLAIGDVAEDESSGSEDGQIPTVVPQETLPVADVKSEGKKTAPPPRYKEASLIETMKRLGIGRPSTYSSTLKVLFHRGYIEQEERKKNPAIYPSALGRQVDDFLFGGFPELLEPAYTAAMEDSLDQIADGKQNRISYLKEWFTAFDARLREARSHWRTLRPADPGEEGAPPCPRCQSGTRKREGKFGPFWGCVRFPDCRGLINASGNGHAAAVPVDENAPECPRCNVKMRQRNGRNGPFWGCTSYPQCRGTRDIPPPAKEEDKAPPPPVEAKG